LLGHPFRAFTLDGFQQSAIAAKEVVAGQRRHLIQGFLSTSFSSRFCQLHIRIIFFFAPAFQTQGVCALEGHSCRKATIGSTFVARRAGMYEASVATRISRKATAAKVSGSVALISYNRDCMVRGRMNEATRPTPIPVKAVSKAWRRTSTSTLPELAPNAMRTPISRVRRATE